MRQVLFLFLAILAGCGPATTSPQPSHPTTRPTEKDPWPECSAVRQCMRDNSGEPDKIEVVSWIRRAPSGAPKHFFIEARYRDINPAGAREVLTAQFFFDPSGKLLRAESDRTVDGWPKKIFHVP